MSKKVFRVLFLILQLLIYMILYVSFSRLITTVGKEGYCLLVIMWSLFVGVSYSSWVLGSESESE